MDERDAELGTHQGELLGPVVRTVVDVQAQRQPPSDEGVFEHRQERGGVLGEGDDARGVVETTR